MWMTVPLKGDYMTRTEKWAEKRAEIEREAKEIADALKNENVIIFDNMMGNPIEELENLFRCDL